VKELVLMRASAGSSDSEPNGGPVSHQRDSISGGGASGSSSARLT